MSLALPRTACQRTGRHAVQLRDIRCPVRIALARMEFHSAVHAESRFGLEPGSAYAPMRRVPLGDKLVLNLFPFQDHQRMTARTAQQVLQGGTAISQMSSMISMPGVSYALPNSISWSANARAGGRHIARGSLSAVRASLDQQCTLTRPKRFYVRLGVAKGAVMPEGDQAAHCHFLSCGRTVEIQHVARRCPEGLEIIFGKSSPHRPLGVDDPMSAG